MSAAFTNIDEGDDFVIEADGSISPIKDIGDRAITLPQHWEEAKVKFNAWPGLTITVTKGSKLKSLANLPPQLRNIKLYGCAGLANMAHGPLEVENLKLVDCGMTSLTGAPLVNDELQLINMHMLTTLKGLEDHKPAELHINNCNGLISLESMPKELHMLVVDGCEKLEVIRFPRTTVMQGSGLLFVGANEAHKLSPRLVLVPGLRQIVFQGIGYRDDILKLFNEHLQIENKRQAFLKLQHALIDANMNHMADQ